MPTLSARRLPGRRVDHRRRSRRRPRCRSRPWDRSSPTQTSAPAWHCFVPNWQGKMLLTPQGPCRRRWGCRRPRRCSRRRGRCRSRAPGSGRSRWRPTHTGAPPAHCVRPACAEVGADRRFVPPKQATPMRGIDHPGVRRVDLAVAVVVEAVADLDAAVGLVALVLAARGVRVVEVPPAVARAVAIAGGDRALACSTRLQGFIPLLLAGGRAVQRRRSCRRTCRSSRRRCRRRRPRPSRRCSSRRRCRRSGRSDRPDP